MEDTIGELVKPWEGITLFKQTMLIRRRLSTKLQGPQYSQGEDFRRARRKGSLVSQRSDIMTENCPVNLVTRL